MNKHYFAETQREIADWQGVTITQENAGKHGRIILHYKDESRIVVVANTPSDARAIKNHIAVVRRELRGLGASKAVTASNPIQRERNKPVRIAMPTGDAPIRQNPFENLTRTQPMSRNAIDDIFASIERLRYAEMLEFASILSDVAVASSMRRSYPHDWAATIQTAIDGRKATSTEGASA